MNLPVQHRVKQQGFSLVELLVTIVIALLASLAVFGVLSSFEGKRRTTTSINDVVQSGNFGLFYADKMLRDAGTGFADTFVTAYGCALNFKNSAATTTTIPMTDFPQLSADLGMTGGFVMAPVLIDKGGSTSSDGSANNLSDALIVMGGSSGNAEYATPLTAGPTASTSLPTVNTVPFQASDLLLLTDVSTTVQQPCLLSQVTTGFTQASVGSVPAVPVPLGGQFYVASQGTASVMGFSKSAQVIDLGNPTADSAPTFDILGVNSSHVLIDYQILNQTGISNQVSDGVFEMHAMYGVDLANTGVITWIAPDAVGWDFVTLSQHQVGTPAAATGAYALERVKAIKLGFILRTELPENTKTNVAVTNGPLVLFASTGSPISRNLSSAEKLYRYRTVEVTVPIRNNLLVAK